MTLRAATILRRRCDTLGQRSLQDMAAIVKVNPDFPESSPIARAAELIRRGHVVAIPTDTFYGLAANPFDRAAIEKVFAIKGRSKSAPLLLLIDSVEMARELAAELPPKFHRLAQRFWPGPLTIVVEASAKVPALVTGETGRIGLRVPAAAIPRVLAKQAGLPLTGTSANRTGKKACSTAQEVQRCLGESLALILDGRPSAATRPSTVVSVRRDSWELLREGAILREEITTVLGSRKAEPRPRGSGQKK